MKILELYQDFNVQYQTEGHKHCRPGWINTACPFCSGNPGLHLGVALDGSHAYCWRCGWHPIQKAVAGLLKVPEYKAKQIIREYHGVIDTPEPIIKPRIKAHKLPSGIIPLQLQHTQYLIKRGFDPIYLEKEWNLMGTGPVSLLDGISYSHRIFAPVLWEGNQVTFQCRDITNRHPLKYMACPKVREIMHHKHILYGKQSEWKDTGICVEGITDVWKLGPLAFATFGIEYTLSQIRIMSQSFKRIAVVFDDEIQAQNQADKLVGELCFRGVDAFKITIEGDPGSMPDDDIKHLINNVL